MVCLGGLDSLFRNQITDAGLTAPIGANGSPLDIVGQITLSVSIATYQSNHVFIVVNTLTVGRLLSAGYLVAYEIVINLNI